MDPAHPRSGLAPENACANRQEISVKRRFHVYILASKRNGTLYIGVTSDLVKRVWEHKSDLVEGFSMKYSVHNLVYFEEQNDAEAAIAREKRLKKWNRAWKIRLIEEQNPQWRDLYPEICESV